MGGWIHTLRLRIPDITPIQPAEQVQDREERQEKDVQFPVDDPVVSLFFGGFRCEACWDVTGPYVMAVQVTVFRAGIVSMDIASFIWV